MPVLDILEACDYGLTTAQQDAVKDILLTRERAMRAEAIALQKQAAAAAHECYVKRFGNEISGFVNLRISPYLYHKLGLHYGYECWDDADFLRNVWKHYPETRVKSRSVNPAVTVLCDMTGALERKVKFSKTYAKTTDAVPHVMRFDKEAPCAA